MILFLVLIVVILIGLTAAAVMGKIGGFMADATSSQSFVGLPPGRLTTEAVEQLHFDQALRGYRMNQVDEVLDALCARVSQLESEVAVLSGTGGSSQEPADLPEAGSTSSLPPVEAPEVRSASAPAPTDPPDVSSAPSLAPLDPPDSRE